MSLTKNQLDKLSKSDLIEYVLNNNNTEKKLDEMLAKMEARMLISEKVTDLLTKKVLKLETELYASQQYSRRECLEISGIPEKEESENDNEETDESVDDDEAKVCNLLEQIDVSINPETDIQACHRIKNKRIIVKFSNRKIVRKIFVNKNKLKSMDKNDLNFKPSGHIYINESLCPHYRLILGRCARLKKAEKIVKYRTINGMVQIQLNEHGNFIKLRHEDELTNLFPTHKFEF